MAPTSGKFAVNLEAHLNGNILPAIKWMPLPQISTTKHRLVTKWSRKSTSCQKFWAKNQLFHGTFRLSLIRKGTYFILTWMVILTKRRNSISWIRRLAGLSFLRRVSSKSCRNAAKSGKPFSKSCLSFLRRVSSKSCRKRFWLKDNDGVHSQD